MGWQRARVASSDPVTVPDDPAAVADDPVAVADDPAGRTSPGGRLVAEALR